MDGRREVVALVLDVDNVNWRDGIVDSCYECLISDSESGVLNGRWS